MDYGFAPGVDDHHANLRRMLTNRASTTTLVTRGSVTSVREFIDDLVTDAGVAKPVGDLLLGTHANSQGVVFAQMFRGQNGPSTFEVLEDTLATVSHSVRIPDNLIGYTAGDPVTHAFHVKGCNVGKRRAAVARTPDAPFLAKLKETLGAHVNVTAPKHFHGTTPAEGAGVFEYMCYEFVIRIPATETRRGRFRGFADRAGALAAFRGGGFTYIDGTAVPNADWVPLIPKGIGASAQQQISSRLGVDVAGRRTAHTPRQFRVDLDEFVWIIDFPAASDIPATEADRRTQLRNSLRAQPNFADAHDYPVFERKGYTSFDNFFAGYLWGFTITATRLVCTGRRFEYTVVTPILDRTTGNLIFNFYPDDPNAPRPPPGFTPHNAEFFGWE